MNANRISWGIVFIFAGTIFLLENYGLIDFSWAYLWKFWPALLILAGVNIIFSQSNNPAGKWAIIAVTVVILSALTVINLNHPKTTYDVAWDNDEWSNSKNERERGTNFYEENFDANYKYANLNINGGASKFTIKEGKAKLFESSTEKNHSRYYLRKTESDSTVVLNFNAKKNEKAFDFDDTDLSKVMMKIHQAPIWTINLNMGAGKADFDLSENKVKAVNIKGGAADFNVKIGDLYPDVALAAETGISKVRILIPNNSGCKIFTKTGLSAKEFSGFDKTADGSFATSNYQSASNKITITLKGGLSDFEVKRY